jgi:hypothetical protein
VDCTLQRLLMRGKGDKPLSQIRIKYACGAKVEVRRISPYRNQLPAQHRPV